MSDEKEKDDKPTPSPLTAETADTEPPPTDPGNLPEPPKGPQD